MHKAKDDVASRALNVFPVNDLLCDYFMANVVSYFVQLVVGRRAYHGQ
jgi:hypothetical protein